MPLNTDLSVSPYYDDYDQAKNFAKVLFKPGVAVQVRELNQLQTLLQAQIERHGDNIFKRGTIVDGAQFIFYDNYPFVKINDADSSGEAVNVADYTNLFVTDESNGVAARITKTEAGFEATSPDLNTLYVTYTRAGSNGQMVFSADSQLIVTDLDRGINKIEVLNNVSGFTNNDIVVIAPAIAIQNSTGGTAFANGTSLADVFGTGTVITQTLTGGDAKAVVVASNATVQSNSIILSVRPLTNSLVGNAYSNGLFLVENSFQANTTVPIVSASANTPEAYIVSVLGQDAVASVNTTTSGRIENGSNSLAISDQGSGYTFAPYVTVASATANTSQVDSLQIEARNYYSKVVVANSTHSPVGSGYAFGITDGVIYQKGYFSRVDSQIVVVEKYRTTTDGYPTGKVIGFDTIESVVNSNTDYTLLDISNTRNSTAPGADRLKLDPVLVVKTTDEAEANTEFFSIVEFASGNPFKQIRDTKYNAIETSMAQRTFEQTGNFVMDQFLVNSVAAANASLDSTKFNISVDPGAAYITGRRVQTSNNYVKTVDKGIDVANATNINVDINLGNFIEVNNLGGTFPASKMVTVALYDTAAAHYSLAVGSTPTAVGTQIGSAKIRAVTHTDGILGTPEAKFKLYLFDVVMNTGRNFSQVKSIFYNGATYKAVADVIGTATLRETANNYLVFSTRLNATKTLGTANVEFRSRLASLNAAANGLSSSATLVVAAGPNAYFPYAGALTDNELRDIIITPNATVRANTNITGTITGTSGQSNVTGSATTFITSLFPGAYFRVNGASYRVSSITNNTHLVTTSNLSGSFSANVAQIELPKDIPVSVADLPSGSATVSANTTLSIGLGFVAQSATFGVNITYDLIKNQSSSAAAKTARRKTFVKIQANTHSDTTIGPWCLGFPDVFRLRNVYRGTGTVATTDENITGSFYVDNNQNENYLDHSYLMMKPGAKHTLGADDLLLIEVDVFENPSERPFTVDSYSANDSIEYAVASSSIHTAEIPQFYSIKGEYYDLRDVIDFRPAVVATANVVANTTTATVNPAETRVLDETLDKNVPAPQGDLKFSGQYYLPRADRIVMTANGDIRVLRGYPGNGYVPVNQPVESITLDILNIPAYPSIPSTLNETISTLYSTRMGSERLTTTRFTSFGIVSSPKYNLTTNQNRRYSMADIASMDRRIESVEKAVSLTLVEQDVSNLVIPSSLDEDIARFKFGFAVDNFVDLRLSDIANPQFNASIFEGRLTPVKKVLNVSYSEIDGTRTITLPRTDDHRLIFQDVATDGPVVLPEPPDPPIDPDPKDPDDPIICPPNRPQVTLVTDGSLAHVCGLVPGTIVLITVRHPLTQDIYMQVERTVDEFGCVEAPLILDPPVVEPDPNDGDNDDPIICHPPDPVVTPPIIDVSPDGQPPIIVEHLDLAVNPAYRARTSRFILDLENQLGTTLGNGITGVRLIGGPILYDHRAGPGGISFFGR